VRSPAPPTGRRRAFVAGARPRTLPAAIVPVAVGVAVAHTVGPVLWWRALGALVVALSIQVGTNYANDYSDGVRGADAKRVGPVRLVASGLASAEAVRRAALLAFAVAAVVGLCLAVVTSLWLLAIGAASIAAGWLYTGGPRPYGYAGFGELFVFVFFGGVATVGTAYVVSGHVLGLAFVAAIAVGSLAVALLVVNNLRDIPTDAESGKRTLAVRLGERATRVLYLTTLAVAFADAVFVAIARPWALLAFFALPLAVAPARAVARGAKGRGLVAVLFATARLQLVFGALLALGIAL
jgi:1,4-dihydroxy-2-naphthoate octaprenyltransferase